MTDDDIQHSGSRWEPAPGSGHPGFGPYAPSVPVESGPYAATATAVPPAVETRGRSAPAGKGLLAAVAAGFLIIGGAGGFAVGHATSGNDGAGTSSLQSGFPGQGGTGELPGGRLDRDGDHGGFDGAPGAPLNGTGNGSGTGTLPGAQGNSAGGGNDDGPTT